MFNLTALKNFELEQLDPTKLDLTRFDLPSFDLPSFDLPSFDLPSFDLPSFDLPKFDLATEATRIVELAGDAAYAGIGAAVATLQMADERRQELTDQVTVQVRKLIDALS